MIDVKEAVQIAKKEAAEILGAKWASLEEVERDTYKSHDVWSITLSIPRDLEQLPAISRLAVLPLQYKRFLIDTETGELVAMQLRQVASL